MGDIINFENAKQDQEVDKCLQELVKKSTISPIWSYVNLFKSPELKLSDPSRKFSLHLKLKTNAKAEVKSSGLALRSEQGLMPSYQAENLEIEGVPEPQIGTCYLVSCEVAFALLLAGYPAGSFGIPIMYSYDGYHGVCYPTSYADILACMIEARYFR